MSFNQFVNGINNASELSLALALTTNETESQNLFPVNLEKSYKIKLINLKNNPSHFKKEVLIKGSIKWFSNTSGGVIYGLDILKTAIVDGVTYTRY